jgi:hypothetical protein
VGIALRQRLHKVYIYLPVGIALRQRLHKVYIYLPVGIALRQRLHKIIYIYTTLRHYLDNRWKNIVLQ